MTGVDQEGFPELSDESCDVFSDDLELIRSQSTSLKQLSGQVQA